jgi:hypothetical protein
MGWLYLFKGTAKGTAANDSDLKLSMLTHGWLRLLATRRINECYSPLFNAYAASRDEI